ncbi:hypothetical protein BSKO_09246 [Bryopsis sp. KO-2023]|nr:hypothetical protein BSKO_09246 [Bryopsis sp. KO-2023]
MDLMGTLVRCIFLSAIAFSSLPGLALGKDVSGSITTEAFERPLGGLSTAAARALKSVRKISKGFSGGYSGENFFSSRHLLIEKEGAKCSWEEGECEVSEEKTVELLSSASSDIAKFALQILKCTTVTSEAECSDADCDWEDGECTAGEDFLGTDALKDCMGDAAVFLEYDGKDAACRSLFASEEACNGDDDCTWDEDAKECGFDIFKVLIGVPSVSGRPLGFNEVLKDYQKWLLTTSIADGIATTDDLDEILAWDPVPFQCPDGTSQLVCNLVVNMQEIFVDSLYCGKKFPDGEFLARDCEADPLCGVDEDSECAVAEEVQNRVQQGILTAFVESVENPLIREILVPFFTCANQAEADCKDMCVWDEIAGECEADAASVMPTLGKTARDRPEPLCQMLGGVFESGCVAASASQCKGNPKCEIDEEGECSPDEVIFQEVVLAGDADFKKSYDKVAKKCNAKLKKRDCE